MNWERLRKGWRAGKSDNLSAVIIFSFIGNYIGNFSHTVWMQQASTIAGAAAGVVVGIAIELTIGPRLFGFSAIIVGLPAFAYRAWAK